MKSKRKTDKQPLPEPRVAEIVSPAYWPSAAELREEVRVDMTLEELGDALMQPVRIRTIPKPKPKPKRER